MRRTAPMTGQLALDDCLPDRTTGQHDDRTPTPFDVRQAEITDSGGQHAGPRALWTAATVPTKEYL